MHWFDVGAHGDLGHVDVAVGHSDAGQVLLLGGLTGGSELSHGAARSGLGGLAAGVGVHLGVEHQDVDVLAGSEDMVQAAEADVVGPAVAAEDPHGLLGQVILIRRGSPSQLAGLAVAVRRGASARSVRCNSQLVAEDRWSFGVTTAVSSSMAATPCPGQRCNP